MSCPINYFTVAKEYFSQFGWTVVPVDGKRPLTTWSRYKGGIDEKALRALKWKKATGVALLLGQPSHGVRVRDFDRVGAYQAWAQEQPDWASQLPTSRTARGYHVFFQADIPDEVTSYADGELRAGNGIVVLPPSAHPDGGSYSWVRRPTDPVPRVTDVLAAGLYGTRSSAPGREAVHVPRDVHAAILKTLPTDVGQRHGKIFEFVRRLKAVEGLDTSSAALDAYIAAWHQAALPNIGTKDFDTSEFDFLHAWENVQTPLHDNAFLELARQSLNQPLPAWTQARLLSLQAKRLAGVCALIQSQRNDSSFFLSVRMAGEILGVSHELANQLFNCLKNEGALELVKKGDHKTRKASEWRYRVPD